MLLGIGKGLGGSYLVDNSKTGHSAELLQPDDHLLRDTAKELEQLFDEFQVG